jgi:phospholipid transport system substrate-binding protein
MIVSTQFCARIGNRPGDLFGNAITRNRVSFDRGSYSVSPKEAKQLGGSTTNRFLRFSTIRRSLIVSAFLLLSSVIGGAPRSLAAPDPVSFVSDLGNRALAAMRNGDTTVAKQGQFRQLFRQYFDVEGCARSALGPYWNNSTAQQRQEFVKLYEDYVIILYSAHLGALGGENFKVLGSQTDNERIIVASRIQINGAAPISIDWQLKSISGGYKVTDVIVNGISMASAQHSDLVSVIQRNNGHVSALLIALREKNASNGIIR